MPRERGARERRVRAASSARLSLGGGARARDLLEEARTTAQTLGMTALENRVATLTS